MEPVVLAASAMRRREEATSTWKVKRFLEDLLQEREEKAPTTIEHEHSSTRWLNINGVKLDLQLVQIGKGTKEFDRMIMQLEGDPTVPLRDQYGRIRSADPPSRPLTPRIRCQGGYDDDNADSLSGLMELLPNVTTPIECATVPISPESSCSELKKRKRRRRKSGGKSAKKQCSRYMVKMFDLFGPDSDTETGENNPEKITERRQSFPLILQKIPDKITKKRKSAADANPNSFPAVINKIADNITKKRKGASGEANPRKNKKVENEKEQLTTDPIKQESEEEQPKCLIKQESEEENRPTKLECVEEKRPLEAKTKEPLLSTREFVVKQAHMKQATVSEVANCCTERVELCAQPETGVSQVVTSAMNQLQITCTSSESSPDVVEVKVKYEVIDLTWDDCTAESVKVETKPVVKVDTGMVKEQTDDDDSSMRLVIDFDRPPLVERQTEELTSVERQTEALSSAERSTEEPLTERRTEEPLAERRTEEFRTEELPLAERRTEELPLTERRTEESPLVERQTDGLPSLERMVIQLAETPQRDRIQSPNQAAEPPQRAAEVEASVTVHWAASSQMPPQMARIIPRIQPAPSNQMVPAQAKTYELSPQPSQAAIAPPYRSPPTEVANHPEAPAQPLQYRTIDLKFCADLTYKFIYSFLRLYTYCKMLSEKGLGQHKMFTLSRKRREQEIFYNSYYVPAASQLSIEFMATLSLYTMNPAEFSYKNVLEYSAALFSSKDNDIELPFSPSVLTMGQALGSLLQFFQGQPRDFAARFYKHVMTLFRMIVEKNQREEADRKRLEEKRLEELRRQHKIEEQRHYELLKLQHEQQMALKKQQQQQVSLGQQQHVIRSMLQGASLLHRNGGSVSSEGSQRSLPQLSSAPVFSPYWTKEECAEGILPVQLDRLRDQILIYHALFSSPSKVCKTKSPPKSGDQIPKLRQVRRRQSTHAPNHTQSAVPSSMPCGYPNTCSFLHTGGGSLRVREPQAINSTLTTSPVHCPPPPPPLPPTYSPPVLSISDTSPPCKSQQHPGTAENSGSVTTANMPQLTRFHVPISPNGTAATVTVLPLLPQPSPEKRREESSSVTLTPPPEPASNLDMPAIESSVSTAKTKAPTSSSPSTKSSAATQEEEAQKKQRVPEAAKGSQPAAEIDFIDLTWIDDLPEEVGLCKTELFDFKIERTEEESQQVAIVRAPSAGSVFSNDSGWGSPSQPQLDMTEEYSCLCGQPAVYVCACNQATYCSKTCQVSHWSDHKKLCGKDLSATSPS